jgi:hypothetical protein
MIFDMTKPSRFQYLLHHLFTKRGINQPVFILVTCVSTHISLYSPPGAAHLVGCVLLRFRVVTAQYFEFALRTVQRWTDRLKCRPVSYACVHYVGQMRWGRWLGPLLKTLGRDQVAEFRSI